MRALILSPPISPPARLGVRHHGPAARPGKIWTSSVERKLADGLSYARERHPAVNNDRRSGLWTRHGVGGVVSRGIDIPKQSRHMGKMLHARSQVCIRMVVQ